MRGRERAAGPAAGRRRGCVQVPGAPFAEAIAETAAVHAPHWRALRHHAPKAGAAPRTVPAKEARGAPRGPSADLPAPAVRVCGPGGPATRRARTHSLAPQANAPHASV